MIEISIVVPVRNESENIKPFLQITESVLKKMENENKNIDECLSNYKPPIFWKDKEIVRQQINNWSLEKINELIFFINDLELLVKKNNLNSVNLLNDFILSQIKSNN